MKETVRAYLYELKGAPWLLLKCKSTNAFPSQQLFRGISEHASLFEGTESSEKLIVLWAFV